MKFFLRNAWLHFTFPLPQNFYLNCTKLVKTSQRISKYGLVCTSPEKSIKKCNWYPNTYKNKNGNSKIVRLHK